MVVGYYIISKIMRVESYIKVDGHKGLPLQISQNRDANMNVHWYV